LPIIDPLALDEEELEDAEVFPQGPAVYWRLLGRPGGGTRFSESHFDLLVSLLEGRERGAIIFGAAVMAGDARRFRTLLQLAGQAVADEALDDDAEVDGEDADDFEPDDEET
jgi:hypothetical protein